jgi:hypothetical protein
VVDSRTPPALAEITMKCLQKHPGDRFQRGHELADALIAYLNVSADGSAEHRAAWLARRPGLAPTKV